MRRLSLALGAILMAFSLVLSISPAGAASLTAQSAAHSILASGSGVSPDTQACPLCFYRP